MSRRSTPLIPGGRDGTSQRGRHLPALDPGSVAIDERGHADMLAFVRSFAEQVRFFTANEGDAEPHEADSWLPFMRRDDVALADVVAFMADPERFEGERARWLGRPHFALLLAFLELLGRARDQLNGLTSRHLDYYYREVLQMVAEPAVPDRVVALFRLATRTTELRLPAGTAVQAGRDSSGTPRIYRTERELLVNRASVGALRSVHVYRRITGLPDVRKDLNLTPREVFDRMLTIALGAPQPGDPVPLWAGAPVDLDGVVALQPLLKFTAERLFLEDHELRTLVLLVRRRAEADSEWAQINSLLGLNAPAAPRDFAGNLAKAVGVLDFENDGLPQVRSIDDLYEHRGEADVRAYIDQQLSEIGFDKFAALMPIKRRIDAEWAEINRLLERIGRRKRKLLTWTLAPADPTAFAANLTKALDAPPPWPPGIASIEAFSDQLRALEAHFAMPVERLTRLAALAAHLPARDAPEWLELDEILADAHRERYHATRRARLAQVRGVRDNLEGFAAVVAFALGRPDDVIAWADARTLLGRHLDRVQVDLLENFRKQLVDPTVARLYAWPDVYRVLELAERYIEGKPEPVAQRVEWRNIYAYADATALAALESTPRWKTFGRRPPVADPARPPAATLGWALRSPLLELSQGARKLTLVLGFRGLDVAAFTRGLGLNPGMFDEPALRAALTGALRVELTTAKGWVELPLTATKLAGGGPGDDYWTLLGVPKALDELRPALRLELLAAPTVDPFVALPGSGDRWPMLRMTLRQRWDATAKEWITTQPPFDPLVLASVHVQVDVEGLVDLQLQREDRALDPSAPFEPFGARPVAGTRLYLSHPELVRARLDNLRFDIEWMGLPASLKTYYTNYPGITSAKDFKVRVGLVDRNADLTVANASLFDEADGAPALTATVRKLAVSDVPGAVHVAAPSLVYGPRVELTPARDLRTASRFLVWELTPIDFGHTRYPTLAAGKARELAIGLSKGTVQDGQAGNFAVEEPYTPRIKRLSVAYRAAIDLDPAQPGDGVDRMLHVHPFGVAVVDPADPRLLPRYDTSGELYIGLRDLDPPRQLALLMQLAEGTSDPDVEPSAVEWCALDGDRWLALGGSLVHDSTRGLINSGIVELALPAVAPSGLLPPGQYWLRAAVSGDPSSVCDTVDIRTQAAELRFEDRGNAPDHYAQPLPVGSIHRLLEPDARIAAVEQPYTSFGGRPPERPEEFYTRVSERLRHKRRALTPWDYERLVLQRFGQIYKAKCLTAGAPLRRPRSEDLDPGLVDILVIPDIRAQLPSDAFAPRAPANLLADIEAYLVDRAPAAARVRVRNPHYVAVAVYLSVRFLPGQDERYARKRLNEDITRFLSPWAYDEGAELTIGGKIYANSILDFVDRRDYVDYVSDLKLARSDDGENFRLVVPTPEDYNVATDQPDQVLVAARNHVIDITPELDYQQALAIGINYMKIELDFIVS